MFNGSCGYKNVESIENCHNLRIKNDRDKWRTKHTWSQRSKNVTFKDV